MKGFNIKKLATKTLYRLKEKSPTIMVVMGIVGVSGATIMACKATAKMGEIKAEHDASVEIIEKAHADECVVTEDGRELPYSEKDYTSDLRVLYVRTGFKYAKLFAPAVLMGSSSIALILGSHRIMLKRNAALGTLYAGSAKAFKEYRENVKERLGDDMDKELLYDLKTEKIPVTEVDETGKEKKTKKSAEVVGDNVELYGVEHDFHVFFDESFEDWSKDAIWNKNYLISVQRLVNSTFDNKGVMSLYEVLEMLKCQNIPVASRFVGWVKDNPDGDGFIDFGIFDAHKRGSRDFVNGYEPVLLMEFNYDGLLQEALSKAGY